MYITHTQHIYTHTDKHTRILTHKQLDKHFEIYIIYILLLYLHIANE